MQKVARVTARGPAAGIRRANGLQSLVASTARVSGLNRARAPFRVHAADASSSASDAAAAAMGKAKEVASAAADKATAAAKDAASKVKSAISSATLDVDIKKLLTYNFLVQVGLTAVSWAVVFVTAHAAMATGSSINPTVAILLVGVALSGYSAFLSFQYLSKTKKEGLGALDGWSMLQKFYEHMTINFAGLAATLVALMAQVGTLMVGSMTNKGGSLAIEALAQAASNTLLAHLVSLAFLVVMTRKITQAYQKIADWTAQLEQLKATMPKLS